MSPQQIQYIKLLQLPTQAIEMRVKEELELNPLLEDLADLSLNQDTDDRDQDDSTSTTTESSETDPVDANSEIDWDTILHNSDYEGKTYSSADEDWRESPNPYHESLTESLEQQINLLDLTEKEELIAEQIIGSLDEDGYLRRDLNAIADSIAFHSGQRTTVEEVEFVLKKVQRLDPPGIAARDLRECLLIQLDGKHGKISGCNVAIRILREEWESFEKKHFDKVMKRLNITEADIKSAYECIQLLDPRPGLMSDDTPSAEYITPDFEVFFNPDEANEKEGDFVITLNKRNVPALRVSPSYKQLWEELNHKKNNDATSRETKNFIKTKMEAARSFMEALNQRKHTLMNVMRAIVALQEKFFRDGTTLKPMILKDIAERVSMDVSTISRIVNGKYVQTPFGVYELKYFFNEGVETEDGEGASNRDVKNLVEELIENEDKRKPLSDDALAEEIQKRGFLIARRTVSKYREQLGLPVARLRKAIV